jgi:DNA-binding response OmpR family regulator
MKILIVEDEKHARRIIGDYLKNEGYEVIEAQDGLIGIDVVMKYKDLDLILLDVRMPNMDGFEAIEEIRKISDVPVIFLTALDDNHEEIKGLMLGADDYITKPYSYNVLMARVKSCLRKNQHMKLNREVILDFEIDYTNKIVCRKGVNLDLTLKEFEVMALLVKNKQIALERSNILNKIWGYDYYGDIRTVDTHIKTLRAKLGKDGRLIKTVRGVGYRLEVSYES